MQVHVNFFKKRMKYCLNIYLSSFCGLFIKSYRKIKQRPSKYLSIKAKFMLEIRNIIQKRQGK